MRSSVSKFVKIIRSEWPLLTFVLVMAFVYSTFSLLRHWHFGSGGYDLGIFDQAIWHYSRFEAPASSILGIANLLGDHFHPILIVLAPFYWLFPNAGVLLVAQGILFALAIIPIFLFTRKRLGSMPAYIFAAGYAIFWGVQNAVAYDFHEVAFAVPLIAFAIYFIDSRKWPGYFVCVALLLLVKEDLSILVAFFGLYLLTQKQFKYGIISFLAGTIWFFLVTMVLIPFFAGSNGKFIYWSYYNQLGSDNLSVIRTVLTNPLIVLKLLFLSRLKRWTEFTIFGSFALLAFFSPLIILTIPLILERFLSSNYLLWTQSFHNTATISPIIAMASADGIYRLTTLIKARKVRNYIVMAVSVLVLSVNVVILPKYPLWELTKPSFYSLSANDVAGYEAIRQIPPTASVVAQDRIIPHLSHRQKIYVLSSNAPEADYIIASKNLDPWPNKSYEVIEQYLVQKTQSGYKIIFAKDGWVVYKSSERT